MKPTKKQLEVALGIAVKIMVVADDSSDCNGRCPLYMDCPVSGWYLKRPERKCTREVYAALLAAARKKLGGK